MIIHLLKTLLNLHAKNGSAYKYYENVSLSFTARTDLNTYFNAGPFISSYFYSLDHISLYPLEFPR